jgi:hypothetical protein
MVVEGKRVVIWETEEGLMVGSVAAICTHKLHHSIRVERATTILVAFHRAEDFEPNRQSSVI